MILKIHNYYDIYQSNPGLEFKDISEIIEI